MSLERTQRETLSRNFLLWLVYLEEKRKRELETREKFEFYLAQIALEIRRIPFAFWGKGNEFHLEIKDMLLKFNAEAKKEEPKAKAPEEFDQGAYAKSVWMAILGFPPEVK